MASVSPPKPWERGRLAGTGPAISSTTGISISSSAPSSTLTSSVASGAPPIPERPSSLATAVNRNATAYSPYGANRLGGTPYGGMGSAYTSPYSRMGGMGGYGSSMYGGYGSSMYGGMGGMYGGIPGMGPIDPNDPKSLTSSFSQSTQATFQIIESIVGAFGGFAQMLESTYMATHSSFFAMVSVAEQFGNLRNTLGSILGIFAILRWIRTLIAKITGRPLPVDATALTPAAFVSFEGRTVLPDGTLNLGATPRISKKPFIVFLVAAFGLPYLMGKLIRTLAASQEVAERERLAASGIQFGPDGLPIPQLPVDPSKLDFCRVLYDFTPETGAAVQGTDLDVKKGDLVAVLSKSDPIGQPSQWWRCRARDGRMGYLPAVYLAPLGKPGQAIAAIKSASQSGSRTNSLDSETVAAAIQGPSQPVQDPQLPLGKLGDLSVESFQKSQFYT